MTGDGSGRQLSLATRRELIQAIAERYHAAARPEKKRILDEFTVEMPGLWKAWKAKGRLPTLSTSPLEISPKTGEIPTFPQLRRRRRMEKWKTKSRFPTFPPPDSLL